VISRQGFVPPHSDEAEFAVLGGMMMSGEAVEPCVELLQAPMFYHPEHRSIFSTMLQLRAANRVVDVLTVGELGGHDMRSLQSMVMSCPSASSARHYAGIVQDCWRERELIRVGLDIADESLKHTELTSPVASRVDRAVASLMGLVGTARASEPEPIAQAAVTFIDRLQARAEGRDQVISTGLSDLDDLTCGGGRIGELWVIGARPSMGKTALTLTISRHIAADVDAGNGVLFLTQEDSKDTVTSRFVASIGRVGLSLLRKPQGAPDDMWSRVSEAVEVMSRMNLQIDDQGSLTLLDVRRKVQQARRKGRVDVVVIDYLQLMTGEGANRNIELGAIANGLKATAKELGVWIILLSQLNRKADERPGPPQVSDLRDSGDIEGAADFIGLLHREAQRNRTEDNKHYAVMNVAKQKNGPTGLVDLYFNGTHQQFGNWSGPVPVAKASVRGRAMATGGYD
jgi:replicative DNA helicase